MENLIAYLAASLAAYVYAHWAVHRAETRGGAWAQEPRQAFATAFILACLPWRALHWGIYLLFRR